MVRGSPPSSSTHHTSTNTPSLAGYATFFPTTHDYDLELAPWSWSVVPALRHASTAYPYTPWIFHLSMHALIMNPELSISKHITDPARLESLMQKDVPVVPPDSVIKTFSHLKGKQIDLILTQDGGALSHGSMLIRNFGGVDAQGKDEGADWARFFLDTWFNPLYRSYNFQKAEGHALVCPPLARVNSPFWRTELIL